MVNRAEFSKKLSKLQLSHVDRAIALLYYYRESQEFEERSATGLASDLQEEGFPKPHVTVLRKNLTKSKYTVRGSKPGYYKIDLRRYDEVSGMYEDLLARKKIEVSQFIIPTDWVKGTRSYIEQMVYQINASYDFSMYDGSAVLMRRLMESLIVEVYIKNHRRTDIQNNGVFYMLESLIQIISQDQQITLSRNSPKTMREIKQLGDTAAHDRTYITPQVDIDDLKARYRRLIQELFNLAGITS